MFHTHQIRHGNFTLGQKHLQTSEEQNEDHEGGKIKNVDFFFTNSSEFQEVCDDGSVVDQV